MPWSEAFINNYKGPESSCWTGRTSPVELGPQYLHEAIRLVDLAEQPTPEVSDIGFLGYACDEGVRRNSGRLGAVEGPTALRKALAKMAWHHRELSVTDFGDVHCQEGQLEEAQLALSEAVSSLHDQCIFPVLLGGGHDMAYGHAKGLLESKTWAAQHIGLLNLDAHFDLRRAEPKAHSGSPYHQLLEEYADRLSYLVLGIQKAANPPELFETARQFGVDWVEMGTTLHGFVEESLERLDAWLDTVDAVYLSIDLDGFASAFSPGVSAASPMGFDPSFGLQVIERLCSSKKLISLDLAECNPKVDGSGQTALLGARLIHQLSSGLKGE
ncbi:formimidoylglutamase [Aureicoccus marinus]|uniref:formimidoylglutamase n=1 Tax=Aureicoccus marinus TaxID=754435 RepID=UPI000CF3A382|nr:formimidoylglutamase [Aureicoccus marinus]